MIRTSSNLGLRLGALVAATSLMVAGGAAVASASFAKDNNGNGGNSSNAPGQQSANGSGGATTDNPNGGAVHGDNGGANTPGNNHNSDNLTGGGTGHLAIDVCHATRSASNPYVFITVDFSSVDEAYLYLTGAGKGNGHGDHVGQIWDGQRSGVNWGDIIESISGTMADGTKVTYPGYNLGATSAALGGTGAQILANGCNPLKPLTDSISGCYTLTSATPVAFSNQTFTGAVGDQANWVNGSNQKFSEFTLSGNAGSVDSTVGCGVPCDPNTQTCGESQSFTAESGLFLCEVSGNQYNGVGRVAGKGGPESSTPAAQKKADEDASNNAFAKATGDNIIPPATFTSGAAAFPGYNWNEKTQARFEAGCSPNQSVISATPLPATVAPAAAKPKPAQVQSPASATLPGSVNAGGGSSAPALPMWALAMMVIGALGAAASGATIFGSRK